MRIVEQWQQHEYTAMKPGLERIRALLAKWRNPQSSFSAVHIAGTNGKGSVARMIAGMLAEAGYTTGLYTSPHLVRVNERIQVNGREISSPALAALAKTMAPYARRIGATYFEFLTALALVYFSRRGVEIAVLETGLGGRWDATNSINDPLVSIVTDIDYDHAEILGHTLGAIAGEKAGIIKPCRPVLSGVLRPSAASVLRRMAARHAAPLYTFGKDFSARQISQNWRAGTQRIAYHGWSRQFDVTLSLRGAHQVKNCALALAAMDVLAEYGIHTTAVSIRRALAQVRWPARCDVRSITIDGKKTTLIIDGAHNPAGMKALATAVRESPWGRQKLPVLFSVLREKDVDGMVRELAGITDSVILVPLKHARAADMERVTAAWRAHSAAGRIHRATSLADALHRCRGRETVVAAGSLYLAAELIRQCIKARYS